jgi:hypothetical protein
LVFGLLVDSLLVLPLFLANHDTHKM